MTEITPEELRRHRLYLRGVQTLTGFFIFVLIILVVSLQLQVSARNRNITRVERATTEARDASRDAKRAVDEAIAASRGGPSPRLAEAYRRIKEIDDKVDRLLNGGK